MSGQTGRFALTKTFVDGLAPSTKEYTVWATDPRNLGVRVTGSCVRIDNLQERTAYEMLLTSLGVAKARVIWTKSPGKTGTRSKSANRTAANGIRGSISIKSAKNNSASAGFHYALRMLIIAGDFSFI